MAKIKRHKQSNNDDNSSELQNRFKKFRNHANKVGKPLDVREARLTDDYLTARVISPEFTSEGDIKDFPQLIENQLRNEGLKLDRYFPEPNSFVIKITLLNEKE